MTTTTRAMTTTTTTTRATRWTTRYGRAVRARADADDVVVSRRDALRATLAVVLGARAPEIAPSRPQASYLVWLDCSGLGLDALVGGARSELCLFFEQEARVKLSDGWSYGGEATAQYQRINVACSRAILIEALERIAAAVERRRGGSSRRIENA